MSDTVTKNLRALEMLGQPTEYWDAIVVYLVVSKFDKQTARDWELFKILNELPTLEELKTFLSSKADILDNISMYHSENKYQKEIKGNKSIKLNICVCCYHLLLLQTLTCYI